MTEFLVGVIVGSVLYGIYGLIDEWRKGNDEPTAILVVVKGKEKKMSGGSMDYICFQVKEHVGCFEDKELDELLNDMAELLHEREWFLSGDNCEGSWNFAKKEFKEKWLDGEEHMDYCKDCKHFTNGKENSFYGKCEYEKFCLIHKYEYGCDKFKGSDE